MRPRRRLDQSTVAPPDVDGAGRPPAGRPPDPRRQCRHRLVSAPDPRWPRRWPGRSAGFRVISRSRRARAQQLPHGGTPGVQQRHCVRHDYLVERRLRRSRCSEPHALTAHHQDIGAIRLHRQSAQEFCWHAPERENGLGGWAATPERHRRHLALRSHPDARSLRDRAGQGHSEAGFLVLFWYHQEKSTGRLRQVLVSSTVFGRREWTRTIDPHHVKVVL
jgi:hypothetical protein